MPAKSIQPASPRFRIDAVALTLLGAGGLLTAAIGWSQPISGSPNPFGEMGDWVAGLVVDPLGWAATVFLTAWFVLTGLLVVTRSPVRIAVRFLGWAILIVCGAVAVDWWGAGLPQVSSAGRGGSVGAYLRFGLEDALDPLIALTTFWVTFLAGLLLAVDFLVRRTARIVWTIIRALWKAATWSNDRVADGSDKLLAGLGSAAKVVGQGATELAKVANGAVKAAATAVPARKPTLTPGRVSVSTDTPPPAASHVPITTPPEPTKPEDIPIHVHGGPTPIPLLRAGPPPEDQPSNIDYELPPLSLLSDPEPFPVDDHQHKLREMATLLEKTCLDFGVNIKVVGIHTGPVITQYEVSLETGLRLNKVTTLADDLALNLRVASVRVVAPLPGRNTVGIEVPNEIRQTVRLKEVVTAVASSPKVAKFKLPIFLGKDVEGRPLAYDLALMPHLLIAGRTGTGKSVCLNTIIVSMLLTRRPDECRMILLDPKKVELSDYAHIPHLMSPVVTDEKKAEAILAWAVDKMEERYEWLHRARVRNIASYNELPYEEIVRRVNPDSEEELRSIPRKMPYIVIVIDEVGDLIMKMKKEIEGNIILLAQKS
ncbi:MAG TPA: DNA translocase FtsK 4TM domain-containing protein, partial [Gemmata sp.]|nr:DNA translocase FtsK 4TM domain-containing protein [Gemmata sp.]